MPVNISGWLVDLSSNPIYFTFAAQNHVYGCLSLLEQIEDGEIVLDCSDCPNPVIVYKDLSGEFQTFNIRDNFHMIGPFFGFSNDLSGTFLGWSDNYRTQWIAVFRDFTDSLEAIELGFYELYKSCFSGKSAFEAVVSGKDITEDMKSVFAEAPSLNEKSGRVESHRQRDSTYRARRNTTPLYRRRGFNKTRKQSGT